MAAGVDVIDVGALDFTLKFLTQGATTAPALASGTTKQMLCSLLLRNHEHVGAGTPPHQRYARNAGHPMYAMTTVIRFIWRMAVMA